MKNKEIISEMRHLYCGLRGFLLAGDLTGALTIANGIRGILDVNNDDIPEGTFPASYQATEAFERALYESGCAVSRKKALKILARLLSYDVILVGKSDFEDDDTADNIKAMEARLATIENEVVNLRNEVWQMKQDLRG